VNLKAFFLYGKSKQKNKKKKNLNNGDRETINLGTLNTTEFAILDTIDGLKPQFLGTSYHPLFRNCNHFSEALSNALLHKSIPAYVNRLAYLGTFVQCLLPQEYQTAVEEAAPAPQRFPGSAASLKNGNGTQDSQRRSTTQEDLEAKRERHAQAALRRMQKQ